MSNLEYIYLDNISGITDDLFLSLKNLKKIYCNNCPDIKKKYD